MLLQDQLFVLTSQLLKLDESEYAKVAAEFSAVYGIDLVEPKKINSYSFALLDITENLISYLDWVKELRSKSFTVVQYVRLGSILKVPQKIFERFSPEEKAVQISSDRFCRFFVFETVYSRSTHISGLEMIDLIDCQHEGLSERNELWLQVLNSHIKNYSTYYDACTVDDAKRFMRLDFDNKSDVCNEILKTIQYSKAEKTQSFSIPSNLTNKLVKPDANYNHPTSTFETLPYLKDEALSTKEITMLIDAQNGGAALWQAILTELIWRTENSEEFKGKFNTEMSEIEIRRELLMIEPALIFLGNLFLIFFDFKKNIEIIIPPLLFEKIICPTPPPIKQNELYSAASNPEPWTMIAFSYVCQNKTDNDLKAVNEKQKGNISDLFANLKRDLSNAMDLAKKIHSPFLEAFMLSVWLLQDDDIDFSTSDGISKICSDLASNGFSEYAQNVLKDSEIPKLYSTLKFPLQKIKIALVEEFVRGFGNIGSWYDEILNNEDYVNQRKYIMSDIYGSLKEIKSSFD